MADDGILCDCGLCAVEGPPSPVRELVEGDRLSVLDEAAVLVHGDRQQAYGHPRENHACTAALWNAWIERRYNALHDRDGSVDIGSLLDARAVCWLNILQKASRDAHSPSRDSLVDTAGFARNAEMVGDDL